MLDPAEEAAIAEQFGVAPAQVRRDHLISHLLAALSLDTADRVIFFGGTALARRPAPARHYRRRGTPPELRRLASSAIGCSSTSGAQGSPALQQPEPRVPDSTVLMISWPWIGNKTAGRHRCMGVRIALV